MPTAARRKTRVVFCAAVMVISFQLAQHRTPAEQLPIKTYTTADGLASGYVQRIVRDSRGFLWFCTRDGLSRFDGHSFVNYTMADGLPTTTINHLLETRSGTYWVATNGGGVCRFSVEQPAAGAGISESGLAGRNRRSLFTVYPVGDGFSNRVNVLFEDREGNVWAGTDDGLFRFDETSSEQRFLRAEPHEPRRLGVNCFAEDREGSLWIGTSRGLQRRLTDGRLIRYSVQPSADEDSVYAILIDPSGRLWLAHNSGLVVFVPGPASQLQTSDFESRSLPLQSHSRSRDPKSVRLPSAPDEAERYTTTQGLAHNRVYAICRQRDDGRIWIGTNGGLTEFNGERFRSYTTAHGLSHNQIAALTEDQEGNLWMAAYVAGAMKLTLNGFTSYNEADGLGHNQIHSIYEDQQGNLFAVSGSGFVNQFDGKRFASARPLIPKSAGYSYRSQIAFLDREGEWWILTNTAIYRFTRVSTVEQLAHQRPASYYASVGGLTLERATRCFEDSRGDIWMSIGFVLGSAVTKWERATNTIRLCPWPDELSPINAPYVFCEDSSGNLWIAFYGGELVRYAAGRYTVFKESNGLPAGMLTALYLDHAGRLWIGSSAGGLCRIDQPNADRPQLNTDRKSVV